MNKKLLSTIVLLTIPTIVFGLTQDQINKLTAHLPHGGYAIRKILMEEANLKETKNQYNKSYLEDDAKQLADDILKKDQIYQKMKHRALIGSTITTMAAASLYQQPTQHRFDASAAFGFLSTAIPPFITFLTLGWVIHKIEYFVNGPALAEVAAEKSNRERAIENTKKEFDKKFNTISQDFKKLSQGFDELKEQVQKNNDITQKHLQTSSDQLNETINTVEETKEVNKKLRKTLTEKILPVVTKISDQVNQLHDTTSPNNKFPLCCYTNPNDVLTPTAQSKSLTSSTNYHNFEGSYYDEKED